MASLRHFERLGRARLNKRNSETKKIQDTRCARRIRLRRPFLRMSQERLPSIGGSRIGKHEFLKHPGKACSTILEDLSLKRGM